MRAGGRGWFPLTEVGFGWQSSTSRLLRGSHLKRWKTHFHKGQKSSVHTGGLSYSPGNPLLHASLSVAIPVSPHSVQPTPSGSSSPCSAGLSPPMPASHIYQQHPVYSHRASEQQTSCQGPCWASRVQCHLALQAGAYRTLAEWVNAAACLEAQDVAIKYLQGLLQAGFKHSRHCFFRKHGQSQTQT